jgi:hypothetical protein
MKRAGEAGQQDQCHWSGAAVLSNARSIMGCAVGPHCSFCGTFTGPFSEVEGLFTVLICIPCLEVRQTQPDTLLGLHDPGQPWEQWGCPIKGCGRWFLGPWELEGAHTGRASRLDGHLPAAAALSEPAHAGRLPPQRAAGELTLSVGRWCLLALIEGLIVVLVGLVVDDLQDLDEAEGGPQAAQGRLLVRVDLGHGPGRLRPRWLVAPGPEVQVDPVGLELKLVDLAFAVVLAVMLFVVPGLVLAGWRR